MATVARRLSTPPCFALLLAAVASAQVHSAHFDAQSEGSLGTSYSEDGIVFSNLDRYLGSPNEVFVAEDASSTLAGMGGFSPPNTLGFGGYSPGPGAAFSRCGSFRITPPGSFDTAELTLFLAGGISVGNLVTLEARLAGALVATDSVVVPGSFGHHAIRLSVSGNFDTLHLVGSGSENSGSFFALVDSVQVEATSVGTDYCYGDGTATACPCANPGGSGEGCANSTGLGTELEGRGSASVAADDLEFHASQLPPGALAMLFAGTQSANSGDGFPFGEGLLCASGALRRLEVRQADPAGRASWGPNIASDNAWGSGTTRYFQAWYRDNNSQCGLGNNLSNGVELTFVP